MRTRNSDDFDDNNEYLNDESNKKREERSEDEISREVVEYLMKTHPLIKDNDNITEEEKNQYTERFTKLFDTEKVKEMKASEDKKEIEEVIKETSTENFNNEYQDNNKENNENDEVEEIVQVVRHKPKGFGIKEVEEQKRRAERRVYSAQLREEQRKQDNIPFEEINEKTEEVSEDNLENLDLISTNEELHDSEKNNEQLLKEMSAKVAADNYEKLKADYEKRKKSMPKPSSNREAVKRGMEARRKVHKVDYSKEDFDVEKIGKEKTLDAFFENDQREEKDNLFSAKNRKKITIIFVVVVLIAVFSLVRAAFLSSQVSELNDKLAEYDAMKEENNKLKLDMLSMEEEIERYINGGAGSEGMNTAENGESGETQNSETSGQTAESTASLDSIIPGVKTTGEFDTYTLQEGDTIGAVSTRIYGKFSYYKLILAANGLTEETAGKIKVGQEIKIPKIVVEGTQASE